MSAGSTAVGETMSLGMMMSTAASKELPMSLEGDLESCEYERDKIILVGSCLFQETEHSPSHGQQTFHLLLYLRIIPLVCLDDLERHDSMP